MKDLLRALTGTIHLLNFLLFLLLLKVIFGFALGLLTISLHLSQMTPRQGFI